MENFIFPKRLEKQLNDFLDYPETIPSVLCFYGIPAQGKTSFAKYLVKQVSNEYLYFDANSHLGDSHNASYVMKSIKAMNNTCSLWAYDKDKEFSKAFIIDEWHNFSDQRQDSFKVLFDEINDFDRERCTRSLVIICLNTDDKNTISKVITPAIYSRCEKIRFDILERDKKDIIERAITYFPDLDPEVIKRNVPNWRAIHRANQSLKRR